MCRFSDDDSWMALMMSITWAAISSVAQSWRLLLIGAAMPATPTPRLFWLWPTESSSGFPRAGLVAPWASRRGKCHEGPFHSPPAVCIAIQLIFRRDTSLAAPGTTSRSVFASGKTNGRQPLGRDVEPHVAGLYRKLLQGTLQQVAAPGLVGAERRQVDIGTCGLPRALPEP